MSPQKLVRDRIPEIMRQAGVEPRYEIAPERLRVTWLLAKLAEECEEVRRTPSVEELADTLEVLHAIADALGIRWHSVELARETKRETRGAFAAGVILNT